MEVKGRTRQGRTTQEKSGFIGDGPANQQQPKPNKSRRRERLCPEAVLISPTDGRKYADVLRTTRSKVKPDDLGVKVSAIRETKNGGVLVELGFKSLNKDKFSEEFRSTSVILMLRLRKKK